jgi:hypothetical protein
MVEAVSVEKGLVKKIFWTNVSDNLHSDITHYKKLEEIGFGMLADKENPEKIDKSLSVVCPDGSVFTYKQIENYWTKKNGGVIYSFSSENKEDMKIHDAEIYYTGFVNSSHVTLS